MEKRIACLDLDAFFVEAALKNFPDLRGKAVAVGGSGPRAVICSASYEARKFGVKSAMPVYQAMIRCPGLVLLPVPDNISDLSSTVEKRLQQFCPVVEQASVDEFYLDFTGCDRIYPTNLAIADQIIDCIARDPGLPATIGFGTNRMVSKIASNMGKPCGLLEIFPGRERCFVSGLPVETIPGVGKKMKPLLNSMGVYLVKDILSLPIEAWRAAFGKTGEYLYGCACGESDTKIIPAEQKPLRKGISRDRTLNEDTSSVSILSNHISYLIEKACFQLRQEKLTCGAISLRLRFSDFVTVSRSSRIIRTSDDREIFQACLRLLEKLYKRRLKIRLIGIHLGGLQCGAVTPDLFDTLLPECRRHLPDILQLIRVRYGFGSILRMRSLPSGSKERTL